MSHVSQSTFDQVRSNAPARIEILLVEDSPVDIALVHEGLSIWLDEINVTVVCDGQEALQYLHRREPYLDARPPALIIMDLNLPKKSGIDVLREVKADVELALIPVIVLTTSDNEQQVREAYRLHANCYLLKPLDLEASVRQVRGIFEFWAKSALLPGRKPN